MRKRRVAKKEKEMKEEVVKNFHLEIVAVLRCQPVLEKVIECV